MVGQPPISNVTEGIPVVPTRRAPSRMSAPTRIAHSPGLFVSQSPSETSLTDDQAPRPGVRRAVAVELTPAPPGTLDGYVEIKGSNVVLEVLREIQGEGSLGFQVRFDDKHTEVVSTRDLEVNKSQGGKLLVSFKPRVVFHSLSRSEATQIIKSCASSKGPSLP